MDESNSRRGRGRPRKNPLTTEGDNAFDTKRDIDQAIDEAKFDFIDPEQQSMPEVGSFNPLSESTIERDYSRPPIQEGYVADLEEPSFHQKTFNEIQNDRGQATPSMDGSGQPQGGMPMGGSSDPFMNPNPALNELDDREKRIASEHMVDAVLDTYETLSTMSGGLAKMDEQKVRDLIAEGKISSTRRIPVDEHGNTVSVMEFVQGYNSQVGTAVENDPAFRKKVRPVMIRVFSKRGWGMTDEQFLLFAFGKDISIKAVTLYGMKKGVNDILTRLQDEAKAQGIRKPQPQPQPQQSTPPPPQREYEEPEVEELSDEEIEYMERMERVMAEQERKRGQEPESIEEEEEEMDSKEGVDRMKITFDENPLRETVVREYPAPKVEETFIQGGEIMDEPTRTDDVPPSQPFDTNQTQE
jgi:hypothetical protein